jgi:hypothetical protein
MHRVAAVTLMLLTLPASPLRALEECPIDDAAVTKAGGYGKAVETLVKTASNCEKAYQTLETCQLGSSADNALATIVQSKCEPLFLGKASPAAKQAYKKSQDRCNKIAEKNEGTMYQGLAAVCRAKVARDFAVKHGGP